MKSNHKAQPAACTQLEPPHEEPTGNIQFTLLFKVSSPKRVTIFDVLYVPKLTCNLFSVRAAEARETI